MIHAKKECVLAFLRIDFFGGRGFNEYDNIKNGRSQCHGLTITCLVFGENGISKISSGGLEG